MWLLFQLDHPGVVKAKKTIIQREQVLSDAVGEEFKDILRAEGNAPFNGYYTTTSTLTAYNYSLELDYEYLTLPCTNCSQILKNNYVLSRLWLLYSIHRRVY